jgi:hypothetical protein
LGGGGSNKRGDYAGDIYVSVGEWIDEHEPGGYNQLHVDGDKRGGVVNDDDNGDCKSGE